MSDINIYVVTAIIGGAVLILLLRVLLRKRKPIALNREKWQNFPLIKVEKISHDVKKFTFGLPSKDHVLGLPIGQHISLKFTDSEGKEIIRSYTPTSSDDDLGIVDFVIKVYYRNVHPKFPDGLQNSVLICSLLASLLKMM